MREIVLDTETTGLDPYQGHRMVEIGCLELWRIAGIGIARNLFDRYLKCLRLGHSGSGIALFFGRPRGRLVAAGPLIALFSGGP